MHVILVAVGSAGDVHPFVGLGLAMRERGHRVTLVASGYFEPLARRVGLDFEALMTAAEYESMIDNPKIWSRLGGFAAVVRLGIVPTLRPIYEIVMKHYVPGTTVVAGSSLALGARVAQERHGVPLTTVHLSPSVLRSDVQSPILPGLFLPDWLPKPLKRLQWWLGNLLIVDRILAPSVNAFLAELGLPPARRLIELLNSPQQVLCLFPDWYASRQPDWPPRTILAGFPLYDERGASEPPLELARFLDEEGGPPIVFTPGSANIHGREFFRAAIAACTSLGRRGVLLTRFSEQIPGELPLTVRYFDYAPFSWLLPRSAALVHHGGIGTLSQALAAGVPQLVMPMSHDQPDNAARLARLGVGTELSPKRFRGPTVAAALAKLLNSADVAARCRAEAAKFEGQRPLEVACDAIEQLCAGRTIRYNTG